MYAFKKSKIATILVLLWMILIFALSNQPAIQSKDISEKVTKVFIKAYVWTIQGDNDAKTINGLVIQFNHLVRKLAHGWIYFVLGVLVIKTLTNMKIVGFSAYVLAIVFCIFYATIDEVHQLFVLGRGGQISDILIDTAGAILGMGMHWGYSFVRLRKKNYLE